jgi:hypothetical protein
MKIYEVKHLKCRKKMGYMTEDSVNSLLYCKLCRETYIIPKVFSLKEFSYIETRTLEIENMKEPEPEPINKYVNFESQSQGRVVTYAN